MTTNNPLFQGFWSFRMRVNFVQRDMSIVIEWNSLSLPQWEQRFASIARSNIIQSYGYAKAYCPYAKQRARWGLIKIDEKEAGLIQIFETSLFWGAFHTITIDRGPLWFNGYGNAMHVKRTFEELNKQFPKRFGRRRRILPEIEDGLSIQKMLNQLGLVRMEQEPYQTYWVDLQQSVEDLRANLQQKWRNSLNKAERSNLILEWDFKGTHADWMRGMYAADKSFRGYGGASPEFLKLYLPEIIKSNDFCLGRVMLNGDAVAFVLFVCHGQNATYLIGWNGDAGRDVCAHHFLLWNGLLMLKERGIKELDLGGVNNESAQGIKDFKEGLDGRFVRYVGQYS